ncbi:MAG TPA: hypothetical protein VGZ73_02845 [Bryobacteraceae bacterium]|nr:hypothetical protein [Bryobacteraceae bacterium]
MHDAFAAPRGQPDVDEGVQVLTRGPVHEAFAEVIAFNREPGVVVPKAPPDAIEELPPDQRPAGANVAWIPGYWAWDDEGNDYLWVSGLWRFLPPGRQWIAGYWGKSESGYQWTSGYWADGKAREIEYLPEPPEAVNADPDGEAPSEDQTWIPGVRVWNQNRYTSRPGYWAKMQTNWDWIPAHYVWSPRGYVFVDGYWDYSVGRRGVLFAPVSFDAGVYTQPGFTYSPVNVINTATIIGNLFLRPSYGHYYFGDYYAANYDGLGFYPSYSFHNHFGYDPFYAQQRWQNRQDREWEQNVATQFRNRRDNEDARPPRTLAAQNELVKSGTSKDEGFVVARPLSQLTKSQDSSMRFQPVDKQERQKLGQVGTAIGNHRAERQKLEAGAAGAVAKEPSGKAAPAKVKLSASPIVAKAPHQLSGDHVPPKVHETPEPDLKSEPKSAPKVEPKTEPRPVPKVEPKVEPNPAPKAEPKPDTKPAPKVEPKPAPKAEPKPEPKPAPKAEPKPEPKPAPKTEPKSAAPSGEPKKKTSA